MNGSKKASGGKDAEKRAEKVRIVLMDVDGVLTDSRIIFLGDGGETKLFDAQDGVGIRLAQRGGLVTGFVSGRTADVVVRRAEELGVAEVHQGAKVKLPVYESIKKKYGAKDEEVCFIGDDVVDIPIMLRVGLAAAVGNACRDVIDISHFVSRRSGGRGAVREILEFILKAQGKWDDLLSRYFEKTNPMD